MFWKMCPLLFECAFLIDKYLNYCQDELRSKIYIFLLGLLNKNNIAYAHFDLFLAFVQEIFDDVFSLRVTKPY